jgi:hypothetical protein
MSLAHLEFAGRKGDRAVCDVRIFTATNVGVDYATAVVTNCGEDEDTSIGHVADVLANRVVGEFEVEPGRFIYIEYFPALSATLMQERLIAPARPARFVRVRFDYARALGFTNPRRELIEITEVAYLTDTEVAGWHRELEETAAGNRLYALLGELGPARTFELFERALQRQRQQAEALIQTGAVPNISPERWATIRAAVVELVLCADNVLETGDA